MRKLILFYLGVVIYSLVISLPLIIPYLHSGYFPTHDGEWAVVRLADMFREIRDLQIPPRFSGNLNFGYGYPLFNFAYPFPYYLGVFIHMLGLGFVDTIKLIFAASVPLSAFFMFLASRNIWKNDYAGLISSVLYLYFPYRLVDLYVRGSIGESVAFAIFPFILFCISKLIDNPKSSGFSILGAVGFGCLILTHNIMAVLFSLSLLVFFVGNYLTKGRSIIRPFLFVGILGFVLSAFFSLPALFEKSNILLSQVPIADRSLYFVTLRDLIFSPWMYGIPTDRQTGFTYQIGWPFLLILITAGALFIYKYYKKIKTSDGQLLAVALLTGIVLFILLMFSFTGVVWKLPLLKEINYPWTVLSQIGLLTSLLAGFLVTQKMTKYAVISLSLIAIVLYLPWAKPSEYFDKGDSYYLTNDATTTSSNELMPLWVKSHPTQRAENKVVIAKGSGKIENLVYKSNKFSFDANISDKANIVINTIYYPGWEIADNNVNIPVKYDNQWGVMEINLDKGNHSILGSFGETRLRLIADLISVAGVIFIVLLAFKTYLFRYIKR